MQESKLGAPQKCPNCGQFNPSGLKLPDECLFCKAKINSMKDVLQKTSKEAKKTKNMEGKKMTESKLQRAIFVYEATRLEAKISNRQIVPESWENRDEDFRIQFVEVVNKQCSDDKFLSAEAAHNSWWRKYEEMGWEYGPNRDQEKKTHPDMIPFYELPKNERDKDEIFLRLCAVAEVM